jgi:hypothetical protein
MAGCFPWHLLSPEERKKRNAASTAKNRKYHLPAIAPIGAAASRKWFFEQPPETRAANRAPRWLSLPRAGKPEG